MVVGCRLTGTLSDAAVDGFKSCRGDGLRWICAVWIVSAICVGMLVAMTAAAAAEVRVAAVVAVIVERCNGDEGGHVPGFVVYLAWTMVPQLEAMPCAGQLDSDAQCRNGARVD